MERRIEGGFRRGDLEDTDKGFRFETIGGTAPFIETVRTDHVNLKIGKGDRFASSQIFHLAKHFGVKSRVPEGAGHSPADAIHPDFKMGRNIDRNAEPGDAFFAEVGHTICKGFVAQAETSDGRIVFRENIAEGAGVRSEKAGLRKTAGPHGLLDFLKIWRLFHGEFYPKSSK